MENYEIEQGPQALTSQEPYSSISQEQQDSCDNILQNQQELVIKDTKDPGPYVIQTVGSNALEPQIQVKIDTKNLGPSESLDNVIQKAIDITKQIEENIQTTVLAPSQTSQSVDQKHVPRVNPERDLFESLVLSRTRAELKNHDEVWIQILHPYYRSRLLKKMSECGSWPIAVKFIKEEYDVKIHMRLLKQIRELIPAFEDECVEAEELYKSNLHMAAHKRAVDGYQVGVYHAGELVGEETRYSDMLLVKMLESNNEKYEKKSVSKNEYNGPIQVNIIKEFKQEGK
jgi:hypothetical protein